MKARLVFPIFFLLAVTGWTQSFTPSPSLTKMRFKTVLVDGQTLFYREAGDPSKPTILLLHGFPSTSHMFEGLIDDLAGNYHLVAPDYPGFGNSSLPAPASFIYSFDHLSIVIEDFTQALGLKRFSLYMQDYGGPIGFRLAGRHPERISALIIQNANAYDEGLGAGFSHIMKMQQAGDQQGVAKILQHIISLEGIKEQYTEGAADRANVAPEAWLTDLYYVQQPGDAEIQSVLFYDYHNNLPDYAVWQHYFREHQPPALIVWGRNDPIFTAPGAEAYRKDLPKAEIHLLNGGHFALVEYHKEIAGYIARFLRKNGIQ